MAKEGMEADLASIKGVWRGGRSPLCSFSPRLGSDHPLPLQARATLGLLPSALPMAVLARARMASLLWPQRGGGGGRRKVSFASVQKRLATPKARFSYQVERIPNSQVSPRAPLC